MEHCEEIVCIKLYNELVCSRVQRIRREGLNLGKILTPSVERTILEYEIEEEG